MHTPRGIRYVQDGALTWERHKQGKGFRYTDEHGKTLPYEDTERIKALIIPPAWTDVRICPQTNGHLQAVGYDAKGRKQYIYHPDWVAYNQRSKFESLLRFGEVLPVLRSTTAGHMRQHSLSRERVLATVVWLLQNTFVRIGNRQYAKENQSYGLTTLRTKHVDIDGNTVTFNFVGKSHVEHELDIKHPSVVRTIKECIELPGYELFQYVDDDGSRHTIDSGDVNEYLQSITGEDLTAKDFRTWGGTLLAGESLYELGEPTPELPADKAILQTVRQVAEHLGNTVAVCRTYYIHPTILEQYENGALVRHFDRIYKTPDKTPDGLTVEEYATLRLIEK